MEYYVIVYDAQDKIVNHHISENQPDTEAVQTILSGYETALYAKVDIRVYKAAQSKEENN